MAEQVEGVLEILQDGYGFLRGENYLSSRNDIFVSANRIKSMRLREGDLISGRLSSRIEENRSIPSMANRFSSRSTAKTLKN